MFNRSLSIRADIRIDNGCTINNTVYGSGVAEFAVSDREETLGIEIESEALREFVKAGTAALQEMDERYAREQAEQQGGSMAG